MTNKGLIPTASRMPSGYTLRPEGVYYNGRLLTPTPIWVSAVTDNGRSRNWGFELTWLSSSGYLRDIVISMTLFHVSDKTFQRLMRRTGVELENRILKFRQYILLYLHPEFKPRKVARPDIWLDARGRVIYGPKTSCRNPSPLPAGF